MSVWVLHLPLTRQEEEAITSRSFLPLPFEGLPDLSMINNLQECRHLLMALYPDDPPETISHKIDKFWRQYAGLREEDLIAVPLQNRQELAIAQVTGHYTYQVGEAGKDIHTVPVNWHKRRVPFRKFGKFKTWFYPARIDDPMVEIGDEEPRIIIRDRLPHSYNRFAKLKWFLLFVIAVKGFMFLVYMISQTFGGGGDIGH